MLPQKYIKNFAVAQKLWILRPFFKIFLLRKQLLKKVNNMQYYIQQRHELHMHFFGLAPPFFRPCARAWTRCVSVRVLGPSRGRRDPQADAGVQVRVPAGLAP